MLEDSDAVVAERLSINRKNRLLTEQNIIFKNITNKLKELCKNTQSSENKNESDSVRNETTHAATDVKLSDLINS